MAQTSFSSLLPARLQFLLPSRYRSYSHPIVPVLRLSGAIGAVMPFRSGLAMANVASMLERAFSVPGAKAVAIVINSPGGSAAQSHLIFKRIRSLAEEKKIPVLAFVEDAAASGGYMIACAADEIYADPASIVGSIGVVSASFGFQELIARIGVERRVHTAGENKAMLDPFRPENPEDVARLKGLQRKIHEVFVDLVKTRRGEKLNDSYEDLFSGAFWVGAEALDLGLIDGLGDVRSVLRQRFGEDVKFRMIEPARPPLLARLIGRRAVTGGGLIDPAEVVGTLEERAAWARLGL
ncbi:S49 family peptidase [Microvirga guangxiensis]|uniref:Signal peptide peptidase SppA n=1 Tax=Microvirga guangxiensis TaxID=549386 RepID=A0A1G5JPD8_9HYPH|nr:S49 family peptidase [Microvirga guangxiensis]SCY89771.1 signal peptide peptidase SppA [Microvirga guangxiensis]